MNHSGDLAQVSELGRDRQPHRDFGEHLSRFFPAFTGGMLDCKIEGYRTLASLQKSKLPKRGFLYVDTVIRPAYCGERDSWCWKLRPLAQVGPSEKINQGKF